MLRSVLFVPGVRTDRFAKALAAGADAVVFDLEDSVDAARKADARREVGAFLSGIAAGGPLVCVRVNACGSRWIADDLAAVTAMRAAQAIVLPKAQSAADVEEIARVVSPRPVLPLIETARGVLEAGAIAAARATIPALLFGAEDLTAELGVPRTVDGDALVVPRSLVALAAAAAGADAIDAVFTDVANRDRLREDALRARALGFRGKMAIHPDQIAVIHEVFTPTAVEIDRARRIVEAYDAARARGEGVVRLGDEMIDAPVVARARRVLG